MGIVNIYLNGGINRGYCSYECNMGSCEYKVWKKLDINGIEFMICNINVFFWY